MVVLPFNDARPIYRENPCPLCRYGNLVDCWLPGFICDLCDHILKKLDNDEWLVFKSDWTFIVVVYFDFEGKIIRKEKTQTTTYLQAENLYKTFEFVRLE
jgi:hypothetical protein